MEKKINKREFANEVKMQTNYGDDICMKIVNIFEDNFFIFKDNKDNIITALIEELEFTIEEANNVYNILLTIVKTEIKNRLSHPFRNISS